MVYRKIQLKTGEHRGIHNYIVEYRKIQWNTGEYSGIQDNTGDTGLYSRIQKKTLVYRKIQWNTGEYSDIQENTVKYWRILQNTEEYVKVNSGEYRRKLWYTEKYS